MWGKKGCVKQSDFFKGNNIFDTLSRSTFGKFRSVIAKIFNNTIPDKYVLPKVIAIGDESTGKSSLFSLYYNN